MAKVISKKIFTLHSWLGLLNGIWLLILGISGSLLVYGQELDRWLNKDILTVAPRVQALPLDTLYKIARKAHPEASGMNVGWFPRSPTDCYTFRLYDMAAKESMFRWVDLYNVDMDPYTGKILREGYYRDFSSFIHWTHTLHYSLHLGMPGILLIAIAGILLFASVITGLFIYRKYFFKVLVFRAPVKWKNWRTVTSGLHRYIGVWSLLFNILIFYSGLQMNWVAFDGKAWQPPAISEINNEPYANIDQMKLDAGKIFPGFKVKYIYIPFTRKTGNEISIGNAVVSGDIPGTPSIIPRGSSSVSFDIKTGAVVNKVDINEEMKKKNIGEKFNAIAYSFHVGSFAGAFSRVLYVFIGLAPAFLSLSGFMLWWRRKHIMSKIHIAYEKKLRLN